MDLAVTRDDSFINKSGSGYLFGMQVQTTGQPLATPDSVHTFGRVQKSIYQKTSTQTKEKDQGGVEVVVSTDVSASFETTIMQRDKTHIDLPEDFDGLRLAFIQEMTAKKMGASANKIQYLYIANSLIEPTTKIDGTSMYPEHKYTCYALEGDDDVTVNYTVNGSFGSQTLSGTCAVGDYHVVLEMTAA